LGLAREFLTQPSGKSDVNRVNGDQLLSPWPPGAASSPMPAMEEKEKGKRIEKNV